MKPLLISFFSFAVWCLACTFACSQSVAEEPWPNSFISGDELLDYWISVHYDVYGEDISSEPWAQSYVTFWNHMVDIGALPNCYWGIAPHSFGSESSFPIIGQRGGIEFVGAWPVYVFTKQGVVPPDLFTLQFYLQTLRNVSDDVFEPFYEIWAHPPLNSIQLSELLPWWSARLLVSNAVTHTLVQAFNLNFTRVFLMMPYYPAWWALRGSYFALEYDWGSDRALRGDNLGYNAPWLDYDGYVFYATNSVRIRQEIKWTSPR